MANVESATHQAFLFALLVNLVLIEFICKLNLEEFTTNSRLVRLLIR